MNKSFIIIKYFLLFFFITTSYYFIEGGINKWSVNTDNPFALSANFNSNGNNYVKQWEEVAKFEKQSLPKSALKIVDQIYLLAKKERNEPQLIKALLYKLKYKFSIEEDAYVKCINDVEIEIKQSDFPVKQILQSILAEFYWNFYKNNRYKFLNRTALSIEINDINTWDVNAIISKVDRLHKEALQNEEQLKDFQLKHLDDILVTAGNSKTFRPTLFDFLAHRALDFYQHEERTLIKPADEFELLDHKGFLPAEDFIKLSFITSDNSSLKFNAILLYQRLINFHLNDISPEALVDIDLARFKYIFNHNTLEEKDSIFEDALIKLEKKYSSYPISSNISYELALHYFNKEKGKKHAYDICEKIIQKFPNSSGAINCISLKSKIEQKTINIITEKTIPPNLPFRVYILHNNVHKVYVRIIEVDEKYYDRFKPRTTYDEKFSLLAGAPVLHSWLQNLPNQNDFESHRVEFKVPALSKGLYAILLSEQENFLKDGNCLVMADFWVTELGVVNRSNEPDENKFYILNSSTGFPISGATIETYKEIYDHRNRAYQYSKGKVYTTDKYGSFTVSAEKDYGSIKLKINYNDDKFYPEENFYNTNITYPPRGTIKTHLFTDRSIYRPGQTIYFKGIMIHSDNRGLNHEILKNEKSTVIFYNVNGQKVSELQVTTNEFGSFSGSFTAPNTGLNGMMRISDYYGSVYFNIEEYKRPKFEVKFQPVTTSYRLEDTVVVKGIAQAYAGSNIDNATVQYRVFRKAHLPYWYWRSDYSPIAQKEITHGNIVTNSNGEFTIKFIAKADKSISKKLLPQFQYTVQTDVTDINGETQSNSTMINAGYQTLIAHLDMPKYVDKSLDLNIKLITTNLNGDPVSAQGNIIIEKLKEPQRLFRKRLWDEPDQFTMTQEEYYKNFDYDIYKDENLPQNFPAENSVMDLPFNTEKQKELKILSTKLQPLENGTYRAVIITKDKFGEQVKSEKYFNIFSQNDKNANFNEHLFLIPIKSTCEPDEVAKFLIGTAADHAIIYYQIENKNKIVKEEWLKFDKSQKKIEIPITEEHRGGISLHVFIVKHHRFYSYTQQIIVPWTNKQLNLEFATFRDKLQPGDNEQWKITVKGNNADKINAEMVATLYDASLDALKQHKWNFNLMPVFQPRIYLNGSSSFNAEYGLKMENEWNKISSGFIQRYDALNMFGLSLTPRYLYSITESSISGIPVRTETLKDSESGIDLSMMTISEDENKQVIQKEDKTSVDNIKVRSNLNETAFFYPNLTTNENGEIVINFTIPEALTKWRLMSIAHTPDLKIGYAEKTLITQKELMVQPNPPRFLREGDEIFISTKVTNISPDNLSSEVKLELLNPINMQPVDYLFGLHQNTTQNILIQKDKSASVSWKLKVPKDLDAVVYRITAKAENFSDGEEGYLPILPSKILITESLSLSINGKQNKTFVFNKLLHSDTSKTIQNHRLTLEFTSNPVWYAVQALPYMMEYPYECSEQVFSRFYSNAIAVYLANSDPKIKTIFESWKNKSSSGNEPLKSNLEKNEELKSLLLEETPWLIAGKNESERKHRLGILFEENTMKNAISNTLYLLTQLQSSNGGWPWFKGMPDDRYITQHIVSGFGHLKTLKIYNPSTNSMAGIQINNFIVGTKNIENMITQAIDYIDARMYEEYNYLINRKVNIDSNNISPIIIQYLYARSHFNDKKLDTIYLPAFNYWKEQTEKFWTVQSKMSQAMIALALNRFQRDSISKENISKAIIKSLKEYSLHSEELGMYWKELSESYYWHRAPIETQALLIEAFSEVTNDRESVDAMKIWLLKQKQVQDWKTTKATAEACYALLLQGSNLLASDELVSIKVGNEIINAANNTDLKAEAGTGYLKTSWTDKDILSNMSKVEISKSDDGIAWGALHWQYFEQLDRISSHETSLKLNKHVFLQEVTDKGLVLNPITETTKLTIGDLLKVRLEIKVDRSMEYIHLKDMRGAGLEPLNVISQYKYQDGLGYYESTKDASTNFFITWLPKGTYVLEYSVRVSHKGVYQNGIATIQCMYAPEFNSHSEGKILRVE